MSTTHSTTSKLMLYKNNEYTDLKLEKSSFTFFTRVQVSSPSPKSNRKGNEKFGLWAVSKILSSVSIFKHEGGLY